MMAISIRQPFASLIVHGIKSIENRNWSTSVRGRVLIHASLYRPTAERLAEIEARHGIKIPAMLFGGIVGSVEIVDVAMSHPSPWFCGPFGFVLANPRPLPFLPCKGALGFFNVEFPSIEAAKVGAVIPAKTQRTKTK